MPSVEKFAERKSEMTIQNVGHTVISYILNVLGIGIMIYIGVKYLNNPDPYNRAFANYAFVLAFFGFMGFITIDYLDNKQISLYPKQWKDFDAFKFLISVGILFIISIMIDYILKITIRYAMEDYDIALYYVFAGVCEEAFFRGFIMNIIIWGLGKYTPIPKIINMVVAILVSSYLFMFAHLQVYGNNLPMLLSTFFGGLVLGTFYAIFRDIGANMAAHSLKNVFGYINLAKV